MPDVRFSLGGSEYRLVESREITELGSEAAAQAFLRAGVEGHGREFLRRLVDSAGIVVTHVDDATVMRELSALFVRGTLVVVRDSQDRRVLDEQGSTPLTDLVVDGPGGEEPAPSTPSDGFVALRLINDEGEPIRDREFTLELPDGRTLEARTGSDGRFRVDSIDVEGECLVRFAAAEE